MGERSTGEVLPKSIQRAIAIRDVDVGLGNFFPKPVEMAGWDWVGGGCTTPSTITLGGFSCEFHHYESVSCQSILKQCILKDEEC